MKNNTFAFLFAALSMLLIASACKKEDVTAPVVTLSATSMTIPVGSSYTDPSYTATDGVDGDLTSAVVVTGTVNTNAVGTYTRTFTATDKAGNAGSATLTVNVSLSRDAVLGNYTTTTTCSSYPYNTVASSTTFQAGSSNDKFIINLFYFNGGTLSCTISGSSVTVDGGQAPNPILDGVTGSGTFNASGKSLTMNYTFQPNGGSPTSCSVTYTRP